MADQDTVNRLLQRAEGLGFALRCAASNLSQAGLQVAARARTVHVVDGGPEACGADPDSTVPRYVHAVMTSVADETKATVIATGRLLGGIDAYWRVCSDASRACRRDMTAPPRGIDSVLELMCEVLARAHALCCHAIVRARWATTLRADEVDEGERGSRPRLHDVRAAAKLQFCRSSCSELVHGHWHRASSRARLQ